MSERWIIAIGVNGATGEYLLPPLTPRAVSTIARGEPVDEHYLQVLQSAHQRATEGTYGPRAGLDSKNLASTGWCVVFAQDADPAIRDALAPLLALRREQAGPYYKEFHGPDGLQRGESARHFLARHGTSSDQPADPTSVPYYVLLVGDPRSIPYELQFRLDIVYAVGRLSFATLDEYAQYARSVVAAETGPRALRRRATLFGVENADDLATRLSTEHLVKPLTERLTAAHPDWQIDGRRGEQATKSQLMRLLGGDEMPAVLFTAGHGLGFPNGHPRQLTEQGALICQDWLGPRAWRRSLPPEVYVAASDIDDDARPLGLIAIHFACYGAGTPQFDGFVPQAVRQPAPIAPHAFVASLPCRLLAHPNGGALAIVAHVERAWINSFYTDGVGSQTQVFEDFFKLLLEGHPIGSAMECFNLRYAALSSELREEIREVELGKTPDEDTLASLWTASNDARGYVIIGDPAVRITVAEHAIVG